MMTKQQETEYKELLPFLEEDISNCLYIYMDLINGAAESADMDVWVQRAEGDIELVLLRYYESFQLYSTKENPALEEAVCMIRKYRPQMVSGRRDIIETLEKMTENTYRAEYGYVYEINDKMRLRHCAEDIVALAGEADAAEIAHLIGMDQGLGGHYDEKNLAYQLRNRMCSGTGRSYILREDGRIVAHTAAYAETKKYAVVSGTIVHPDYRDKAYYSIISSYIVQKLREEGKRSFTFAVEPRMVEYHDKMDYKRGSYGRLVWGKA